MKKSKAFMIDEETYNEFKKIAKENGYVMSILIENYMKGFIKKSQTDDKDL